MKHEFVELGWKSVLAANGFEQRALDLIELDVMRFLERRSGYSITTDQVLGVVVNALVKASVLP